MGRTESLKQKTKNKNKKKPYLGYNICYFVEGHIGYCLPLVKTSLFADWKCVVIGICQPLATLFNDFSSSDSSKTSFRRAHEPTC